MKALVAGIDCITHVRFEQGDLCVQCEVNEIRDSKVYTKANDSIEKPCCRSLVKRVKESMMSPIISFCQFKVKCVLNDPVIVGYPLTVLARFKLYDR